MQPRTHATAYGPVVPEKKLQSVRESGLDIDQQAALPPMAYRSLLPRQRNRPIGIGGAVRMTGISPMRACLWQRKPGRRSNPSPRPPVTEPAGSRCQGCPGARRWCSSTPECRWRNRPAFNPDMPEEKTEAPGQPGIAPTWTSSAKDAIGCPLGPPRLWFTLGHGIVNEVYYPRIDIPQIRDLGFIIADGRGFWVEVKRAARYDIRFLAAGVPAFEITHRHDRYRLRLRISPDPRREVLAIEFHLDGDPDLRPYVLIAPHLGATGRGNWAAVERYASWRAMTARQGPFALALVAVDEHQRDGLGAASAGYVGTSDGWQDFARNGALTWTYATAGPGNVALIGTLPRQGVLGLGFGTSAHAAATLAIATLLQPFENLVRQQIAEWEGWQAHRSERYAPPIDLPAPIADQFLACTIVLRAHLDKTYPGAMVASLSIPWGNSGEERGGYHLVWPRDLVACAGALLALGAEEETRDTLRYLIATQHPDGHWNQNQWLGGKAFWEGLQLDETAFPVLLAAALAERGALGGIRIEDMVRRSLSFIACNGPMTGQERWEENAGINAFTLAVAIAALVEGAAFLPADARAWALDLADFWNASIERWLAVRGTELAA